MTVIQHNLVEVLRQVLSPDAEIRKVASNTLLAMEQQQPDIAMSLLQLIASRQLATAERQLAALTLKNYVDTHWSQEDCGENFKGPEPPMEVKQAVRQNILGMLSESEHKIRVALAYCVSRIAHYDYPEMWPSFTHEILELTKSSDANVVDGAVNVLQDFVSEDLSDEQFPQIAPVLFQELFRVFSGGHLSTRIAALTVFRNALELLYMMSSRMKEACDAFLVQVCQEWLPAFKRIMDRTASAGFSSRFDVVLVAEISKCLAQMFEQFKHVTSTHAGGFVDNTINLTFKLVDVFIAEQVQDKTVFADDAEEALSGVSTCTRVDYALYAFYEFILILCKVKKVRATIVKPDSVLFKELIRKVILSLQVTIEDSDSWESDPNQFVADEDDETFSMSLRIAADQLITSLVDLDPKVCVSLVSTTVQEIISSSLSNVSENWRPLEACLFCLGRISDEIITATQDGQMQFPFTEILRLVVDPIIGSQNNALLRGRCIWFASKFVSIAPADVSRSYFEAGVKVLIAPREQIAVKVLAIKSLQNYSERMDSTSVSPYIQSILQSLSELALVASEEFLILIMETLSLLVNAPNLEALSPFAHGLVSLVVQVWTKNPADPLIVSIVEEMLGSFVSNAAFHKPIQELVMPVLIDCVLERDVNEQGSLIATALDIVTELLARAEPSVAESLAMMTYLPVMKLLLSRDMEDSAILQSGQLYLRQVVVKCLMSVARWNLSENEVQLFGLTGPKTALDLFMIFLERALDPERTTESGALFIGDVVWKMVRVGGDSMNPILPSLVTAVIRRMEQSKTSSVIQSLVIAVAQLILKDSVATLNVLKAVNIEGKSGLDILLDSWSDNFEYFHGHFAMKLNVSALTQMLLLNDDAINNKMVKDKEIIDQNSTEILTRSKAKKRPIQFSYIKFPLKALQSLVTQLKYDHDAEINESLVKAAASGNTSFDHDVDDSGEWEDEGGLMLDEAYALGNALNDEDTLLEDDEELKNDPLYQLDTKKFLCDFFVHVRQQDPSIFQTLPQEDVRNLALIDARLR
ncbi:hypothetical protein MP638_005330 [Amoeboaphelidium occidentale]|nr:hypothetical protein MP638_005330 [Amoeboaphelidium occidentale]